MKLTQKETFNFGAFGFVGRVRFEDRWTRRGRRKLRPIRTEAKGTLLEAIAATEKIATGRWSDPVREYEVVKVDSLGAEYGAVAIGEVSRDFDASGQPVFEAETVRETV